MHMAYDTVRAGCGVRLRYEEHTWPELRELAERDDLVVVIPTATLEDHGYHLPIDTDARLVSAICERRRRGRAAGRRCSSRPRCTATRRIICDFPGSVTLRWNVFVEALVDQGRSLCRHGFDRILFVNGHGSNQPLVDIAARLISLEHRDAVCGSCFYLQARGQARHRRGPRLRVAAAGWRTPASSRPRSTSRSSRSSCRWTRPSSEIPDWDSEYVWLDWSDGPLQCGRTGRALAAAAWWAMRL